MEVFAIPVLAEMDSKGDCPKTLLQEVLEGAIDDHRFNFFRTKAFHRPSVLLDTFRHPHSWAPPQIEIQGSIARN
jgi:hypothetical protein